MCNSRKLLKKYIKLELLPSFAARLMIRKLIRYYKVRFLVNQDYCNPFQANTPFLYSLNTLENFEGIEREHKHKQVKEKTLIKWEMM